MMIEPRNNVIWAANMVIQSRTMAIERAPANKQSMEINLKKDLTNDSSGIWWNMMVTWW